MQMETSDDSPGSAIRVEVEDFGAGIPPEDRQRVFEPFFTTKSESAGLGLWASSQIVDKHGGTIEFRNGSPDGKQGTCFCVVLPIESGIARAA
jgi:signal transduction histidine kinase